MDFVKRISFVAMVFAAQVSYFRRQFVTLLHIVCIISFLPLFCDALHFLLQRFPRLRLMLGRNGRLAETKKQQSQLRALKVLGRRCAGAAAKTDVIGIGKPCVRLEKKNIRRPENSFQVACPKRKTISPRLCAHRQTGGTTGRFQRLSNRQVSSSFGRYGTRAPDAAS